MSIKSKVMTIANALVKQGVSRSAAMVRAWITVKMRQFYIKAVGVTHGNRQTLLDHLTRYKPEDITVTLQREKDNAYDSNAIGHLSKSEPPRFGQRQVFCYNSLSNAGLRLLNLNFKTDIKFKTAQNRILNMKKGGIRTP